MEFKTYWQRLATPEREAFAERVGTSVGYCHQIAYGAKHIELGLADAIVAAAGGDVGLADLPLTERAKFQDRARSAWKGKDRRKPAPQAKAA